MHKIFLWNEVFISTEQFCLGKSEENFWTEVKKKTEWKFEKIEKMNENLKNEWKFEKWMKV